MRTIGQYYKETVLCLPKKERKKVELPSHWDDVRIEEDLFGWKLWSGNEFIECSSEEEAKYLKVFFDSDVYEFDVPKDNEYLKKILPQLLKNKAAIDEIIDDFSYGILDRQIKAKLRHMVFVDITKELRDI